jgi:3'-phosphoadenosine 5'-phosphosulfate sulfotransferase
MTDSMTDAEYDAQLIQFARADDEARKAATDKYYPDFDIYAEEMCDPRHSLRKWHDDVVRIPSANKGTMT